MTGTVQRVGQVIALAGVAALLGLLVWKVAFGTEDGAADDLAAGKVVAAPAFSLERLDEDGALSIADLRGKALVVNFWASWCDPCKAEAGRLEAAYRQWSAKGVQFVGIDANDFSSDGLRFAAKHGISYTNLEDGQGSTLGHWGVTGFPETFFVDAKGRVVAHVAGEISAASLQSGIQKSLS